MKPRNSGRYNTYHHYAFHLNADREVQQSDWTSRGGLHPMLLNSSFTSLDGLVVLLSFCEGFLYGWPRDCLFLFFSMLAFLDSLFRSYSTAVPLSCVQSKRNRFGGKVGKTKSSTPCIASLSYQVRAFVWASSGPSSWSLWGGRHPVEEDTMYISI